MRSSTRTRSRPLVPRAAWPAAALLGGCATTDASPFTHDLPGGVAWESPRDGEPLSAGALVELRARAYDRDSPSFALEAVIRADGQPLCPPAPPADDGAIACAAALPDGEVELTVELVDGWGRVAEDAVLVEVAPNAPPSVALSATVQGAHETGYTVWLEGHARDPEGAPLAIGLRSSEDGPLGRPELDGGGAFSVAAGLRPGAHTLTLEAADPLGAFAVVEVELWLDAPGPGACALTHPADGAVFRVDAPLTLGAAVDPSAGRQTVAWSSDLDGLLAVAVADGGGGARMEVSGLQRADHVLTLEASDGCRAEARVRAGGPPVLSVDPPAPAEGLAVLTGAVSDLEDPPERLELRAYGEDGALLGAARPEDDGRLWLSLPGLAAPGGPVRVQVIDPDGMAAEAWVTVPLSG